MATLNTHKFDLNWLKSSSNAAWKKHHCQNTFEKSPIHSAFCAPISNQITSKAMILLALMPSQFYSSSPPESFQDTYPYFVELPHFALLCTTVQYVDQLTMSIICTQCRCSCVPHFVRYYLRCVQKMNGTNYTLVMSTLLLRWCLIIRYTNRVAPNSS